MSCLQPLNNIYQYALYFVLSLQKIFPFVFCWKTDMNERQWGGNFVRYLLESEIIEWPLEKNPPVTHLNWKMISSLKIKIKRKKGFRFSCNSISAFCSLFCNPFNIRFVFLKSLTKKQSFPKLIHVQNIAKLPWCALLRYLLMNLNHFFWNLLFVILWKGKIHKI